MTDRRTRHRYYDRDGEPVDPVTDGAKSEGSRVLFTRLDSCDLSTVFLGLNHNWVDGPPLIFETMIFGGEHNERTWRYHTEESAARGHLAILDALRAGRSPDDVHDDRHC